jgi:ATP-dependent Clp protease, protease subunit
VTVEVLGWAASAASIIAMAGDEIVMGLGTFMMVHNAWGIVVGNRHDMRDASSLFEGFDAAIVDIYEARTGRSRKDIEKLMDAESFMGPTEAVEKGFADRVDNDLGGDEPDGASATMDRGLMARRQTEAALAKAGFSRSVRAEMLSELTSSLPAARDAGRFAARDAGVDLTAVQQFIATLKH